MSKNIFPLLRFFIFLTIICIFIPISAVISSAVISSEAISYEEDKISLNVSGVLEPESLFEIRVVSPDMLDSVISQSGSEAVLLKADRGVMLGVATTKTLYIRGDLSESFFPVRDEVNDTGKEEIAQHMIDIVFGRDNPSLVRWNSILKYYIRFTHAYNQRDLTHIYKLIDIFNDLSETTQIIDDEIGLPSSQMNYAPIPYNYYSIGIISEELFEQKQKKRDTQKDHLIKERFGRVVGMVNENTLFLLDGLDPEDREFYLYKGILWSMGLHGESSLKESFFYSKANNSASLFSIDKDAIRLLYGGRLSAGMELDAIKKSLGIDKKLKNYI